MTTTHTLTLTAFLAARLDEDEAAAQAAQSRMDHGDDRWWVDGPAERSGKWWIYATGEKFHHRQTAAHIARHDPARVLAEVAAKREVLRRARRERGRYEQTQGALGNPIEAVIAYETSLRHLAAVYRDHPDFEERWLP